MARAPGSVPASPPPPAALDKEQRHALEYAAMTERVRRLDEAIQDALARISQLHQKRSRMAELLLKVLATKDSKDQNRQDVLIRPKSERMERLNACKKLLGKQGCAPCLQKNLPLPDLPDPEPKQGKPNDDGPAALTSVPGFLRASQPDLIVSDMSRTGTLYSMIMGLTNDDEQTFWAGINNAICGMSPPGRHLVAQHLIESTRAMSNLTALVEHVFKSTDPVSLINQIETTAAVLVNARRVRFFLRSDTARELVHLNGKVKVVVSLDRPGLIASCVQGEDFCVIDDPKNLTNLDVMTEGPLFEGASNVLICRINHPHHVGPFVFIAIDKIGDGTFCEGDYVLLKMLFEYMHIPIAKIHQDVVQMSVDDETRLIEGIAAIANQPTPRDMTQKIVEIGNSLSSATVTKIFRIENCQLYDETPGAKAKSGAILSFEKNGLIVKSILEQRSDRHIVPRRETDFNVQIDDITEPRVWSMMVCPSVISGKIPLLLAQYNRVGDTFFSGKDMALVETFSKCIGSFLPRSRELAQLTNLLNSGSESLSRECNLTAFAVKAIQTTGTDGLFRNMTSFCDRMNPRVTHRILLYGEDKLVEIPQMTVIGSQPQWLEALMLKRSIAATIDNEGVVVFPVEFPEFRKVFLLEFRADLLGSLKAAIRNSSLELAKVILPLKSVHEDKRLKTKTCFFDLSVADQANHSDIIAVQANPVSSGEQVDEDSLQIFPFDPSLIKVLSSFANCAARQVLMHMSLVSMQRDQLITRSLHVLGNSLACPLVFSGLLDVMRTVLENLFGQSVTFHIFDPPLEISEDARQLGCFNLEKDNRVVASIKLLLPLTIEQSTALASFADLLTDLIEFRGDPNSRPVAPKPADDVGDGFSFDVSNLMTSEMVTVAIDLFRQFHIIEILNVSDEKITRWMGKLASKLEESGMFMLMTDALHLGFTILKEGGWFDVFSHSELAALGICSFLSQCFGQMHPNFKYEKVLTQCVTTKTDQVGLTKAVTNIVLLGDDLCDILEDTPEDRLVELMQLMIDTTPLDGYKSVSYFHCIRGKLNLENQFHRKTLCQMVVKACENSMFFSSMATFGSWIVSFGKEPSANALMKGRSIVNKIAEEFGACGPAFAPLLKSLNEKLTWLTNQEVRVVYGQQQEEEDEGNMSLMDTH